MIQLVPVTFFFSLSNSSLLSVWARNFPESLLFISSTKPADNPSITTSITFHTNGLSQIMTILLNITKCGALKVKKDA